MKANRAGNLFELNAAKKVGKIMKLINNQRLNFSAVSSAAIILFTFGFLSENAQASKIKSAVFGKVLNSLEVRPVFNNDKNLLSVPIGLGIVGEAEVMGQLYWTAEFNHFQLGSKKLEREDGFLVTDVDFERRHVKSTSVYGGIRYYEDPFGNSWYGGTKIGFSRVDATYSFDSTDVSEVSHYVPLILESGYRFVIDEQLTARIGARISRDYVLSQQLSNNQKSDDRLKLEALRYDHQSVVDMGFAYHF